MDAVKFLKAKNRMCKEHDCFGCPIGTKDGGCAAGTQCGEEKTAEEVVQIVEKYAAEHPVKTRQSEFLKMFPDAPIVNGIPCVNPCDLSTKVTDKDGWCDKYSDCEKCGKEYWLEEVLNE